MSRMIDADLRREWSQRVVDHDGAREGRGGVAKWLHLCERLGLERKRVLAEEGVLPATRFAVDAYVHFVRERPLLEAVASSLTELFAPAIIGERTSAMLSRYDFIDEGHPHLLQRSPHPGPARCRLCARLRKAQRHHPGAARDGLPGAPVQDRRAVGAARCAPLRLRCTAPAAARSVRSPRRRGCLTSRRARRRRALRATMLPRDGLVALIEPDPIGTRGVSPADAP